MHEHTQDFFHSLVHDYVVYWQRVSYQDPLHVQGSRYSYKPEYCTCMFAYVEIFYDFMKFDLILSVAKKKKKEFISAIGNITCRWQC